MCNNEDTLIVDGLQRREDFEIYVFVGRDLLICRDRDYLDVHIFRIQHGICFVRDILHMQILADK
jgi:hypothetical protein